MALDYTELSITVIINVLFISLFLGVFFFTYGAYIEAESVKAQMEFLAVQITDNIKILGPGPVKAFKLMLGAAPDIDFHEEDQAVVLANNNTLFKAFSANVIFTILVVGIVYVMYKSSNTYINLNDIIKNNFIILCFIALTEYLFLTIFGSQFLSLNPNSIKYNVVLNLKKLLN